jgi:hypothetical protein
MRIVLSLVLLALLPIVANAEVPRVTSIDVVEIGIYSANEQSEKAAPDTATGRVTFLTNLRLVQKTTVVPARQGIRFGFRYKIVGSPAGATALLHMVTIFPTPGLQNPAKQQVTTQSEFDIEHPVGTTVFRTYSLDDTWEAVPGVWSFQIWYQGKLMAEQKFTVVAK